MGTSSKPPRRRNLFLLLAAVALSTLLAVALLVFRPRPTVVEIELVAHRAAFTVVPPALSTVPEIAFAPDTPAPLTTLALLDPSLAASALDFRQTGRIEATFPEGRSVLIPGASGSVRFTAPEPFSPELATHGPARITVEPSGKDRNGGARVLLWIEAKSSQGGAAGWAATIPAGAELTADLRDVEVTQEGRTAQASRETHTVPLTAPDPAVTGGSGEGRIGLTLEARPGPATILRLLDPETGDLTPPRRLPAITAEPRSLPWKDRLVLLEPDAGSQGTQPLLRADLKVRDPELFQMVKLEPESYLEGGRIRFPAGEKEALEIGPRSLLTLTSEDPLTLRSLGLDGGRLVLVLWGKPASLRLGPTPELQAEILPSQFLWLYTHRLSALIYTTLATVLGTSLALFKLIGLFKD